MEIIKYLVNYLNVINSSLGKKDDQKKKESTVYQFSYFIKIRVHINKCDFQNYKSIGEITLLLISDLLINFI